MALVLRPAAAADHQALVEQFLGLNRFEDLISHDRRTDRQGGEESLAASAQRVERSNGHAIVAELDGSVVGHLFLIFATGAAYVREDLRAHAYVIDLFVRDGARGRGIGRALMMEGERLAAERGVDRLMVGVLAGNTPAATLYADLGYRPHAIELAKAVAPKGRRGVG